jgi:uncharacterized lipoprotein YbaY
MVRLVHVVLGLLFVLALAACGPGGGATAQPAGSTTPTSAPAASSGY